MKRKPAARHSFYFSILIVLCATSVRIPAQEGGARRNSPVLRIGAAANLSPLGPALAKAFLEDHQALTRSEPVFSFASSGALLTQLRAGAPWALFLSADQERPEALIAEGLATGKARVYAISRLCLASRLPVASPLSLDYLVQDSCRTIAVAKPALAPFGVAAMETIANEARTKIGFDTLVSGKIVWANNIAQTASYLRSGAADAAFLPLSIIRSDPWYTSVAWILLEEERHAPIAQAAVVIARAPTDEQVLARAFLVFLAEGRGKTILEEYGYQVPGSVHKPENEGPDREEAGRRGDSP